MRTLWLAAAAAALVAAPAGAAVTGTVTIGLADSASGTAATYGVTQTNGAQLAVDTVNASSPAPAFTLALAVADDQSTGDGAKAAFGSLIDGGAAALLGPTLSSAAFAADPFVQSVPRPLIAISNTADGIPQIGDYVFRASLPESRQIPAAVRVAHRRVHFRRPVMVVRTDQPFAVSGAAAFRRALRAVHAPLVATASYTGTPASFRALLAQLARKHPGALVLETLTEGPQLMRAARALRAFRSVPFLGGNAFNSQSVIKAAGSAAEGLIVGAAWHPGVPGASSRAFVSAYRARFGAAPDQFAATAYTAVLAIADALRRAGTTAPAALRDALAATRGLDSPLGAFGFGADRDVSVGGVVQIVRHGRFVLLR